MAPYREQRSGETRALVINADDFGLSPGVNEGIVEAHVRGVVTSTSLMVDAPAADEAAALARAHPRLSVGLHFVDEQPELDDPAHAKREFGRQVQRFRELTGADPTHLDSHHHVHTTRGRLPVFVELAGSLGVPLRRDGRVRYIGGFYGQWEEGRTELEHIRRPFLLHLIETEALEGFTELACHPARVTGDFSSSYLDEREVELATLTSPGLREEIEALGVRLVSYRAWSAGGTPAILAR